MWRSFLILSFIILWSLSWFKKKSLNLQSKLHFFLRIFKEGSLKGHSNEIFDLQFFHHSNQPGSLTNGLNYFRFWFGFRWDIRIFLNLHAVSYCAESISPQYVWHWAESISTQYDTARTAESCDISVSYLKWQSNEIFDLFFHNSSLPGPLSNGLKYFWFWLRFRRVIRVFQDWLRAVS